MLQLYYTTSILDKIEMRLAELQKELLRKANAKENYDGIADEIYHLREVKQNALADNARREGPRQKINEIQEFLLNQTVELDEYDEQLVRRLVQKLTVHVDRVSVEFESGNSIDVRR